MNNKTAEKKILRWFETKEYAQPASVMEDALLNKDELLKSEHEFM